jgi:hypothetical protein
MTGRRRVGWTLALVALAVFAGALWARELIQNVFAIATGIRGLLRGGLATAPGTPLHEGWEAGVTIGLILLWIVLTLTISRRRFVRPLGLDGSFSVSSALLAVLGTAMFVVLLLATIVPVRLPALLLLGTAVSIGVVVIELLRFPRQADSPDESSATVGTDPASGLLRPLLLLLAGVSLALLVWVIARDIVYLAFYKPAAAGDEVFFWWRSTDNLFRLGYYDYLSSFDVAGYPPGYSLAAGYPPGYPLIGNLLIGWVPGTWFPAASRALPFVFGFSALWILLRGTVTRRDLLSPTAAVYYILGFVLLFGHEWIHSLFFQLWYGEAFATLIFALILILLDHARRETSGARDHLVLGLFGFGLGSFAVLTKPPLSLLLLPAILPTLLIAQVLIDRARGLVRPFLLAVAAMALGGFLTQSLWGAQLRMSGEGSFYSLDIGALLAFKPEGAFSKLVPYFLGGYKEVWVVFILTTALALLHDWRRFLPFWLVSLGMVASVFVLYLGQWSAMEPESGARYILHGAYGWILFSLGALGPPITQTIRSWTSSRFGIPEVRRRLGMGNAAP